MSILAQFFKTHFFSQNALTFYRVGRFAPNRFLNISPGPGDSKKLVFRFTRPFTIHFPTSKLGGNFRHFRTDFPIFFHFCLENRLMAVKIKKRARKHNHLVPETRADIVVALPEALDEKLSGPKKIVFSEFLQK